MAKKNDSLLLRCDSRVGNDCKQITKQRIRNRRAAKMHDTFARIIEILQIQTIRDRRSSPKNIGRVERLNRIYKWLLTPTI